ncbi:MAG: fused MFS/spermidine synthase [Candidatus Tectimicrobiota bacterium]
MRTILYLVFVLSGAAGLIYESIWSRYLGLFVGHSAYAQIIVLAIFLGGMSLGALLVGQFSARGQRPLLWYAMLELAIGLLGAVFHPVYVVVTQLAYEVIFPALPGPVSLLLVKWAIASALIVPQSILLGATFPCMSAGILRHTAAQPGRVLALLYGANSLGAALGVLLAGFVLVALLGLPGTVLTAAGCNVLVALVVLLLVRRQPVRSAADLEQELPYADTLARLSPWALRRLWRWLLGVSAVTALASFVYEIAWIRMLSLVLGSATHAFELMLSAFILGLALGACWVHRRADQFRTPLRTLAHVQWLMGCLALATLPLYLASFEWMTWLLSAFAQTSAGYVGYNLARYGICLVVMLPATFCAGMTLPLLTRILLVAGHGERAIGWVYGINTLGSIVGVLLAGLVLLPLVGLKALLIIGAACDMGVGVLLLGFRVNAAHYVSRRPAVLTGLLLCGLLLAAASLPLDRLVMTSGVYRHGLLPRAGSRELLFYKDGRTATVAAVRNTQDGLIILSTNGKPDASLTAEWFSTPAPERPRTPLRRDAATQVLLPLITLAHVPQARTAAVIGHGSGQSSHLLLGSTRLERLVTIDIEPEMITGSRLFFPANRRVFEDPRSLLVIDDARAYFAAQQQQYDMILSEPSNPWVSGVSGLFTAEFYARIVSLLTPQGVFGQWVQLYELNDDLVLSILAALHQHFASYQLFLIGHGDILIVASPLPRFPAPTWDIFRWPGIADSLQPFIPLQPDDLEAMRLLDRAALAALLDTWPARNTDFFPRLDLEAEKARYLGTSAQGIIGLHSERWSNLYPLLAWRTPFRSAREVPVLHHPRLTAAALGATLRAWREHGSLSPGPEDDDTRAALQRFWQWSAALRLPGPPADWQLWLQETLKVEADLHRGTAGVVDEGFYTALHDYLERRNPPSEVCQVVHFYEALARWDVRAVLEAAERLLLPALEGTAWLPMTDLLDGAVLATLMLGRSAEAQEYVRVLTEHSERASSDVRSRLLEAYAWEPEKLPEHTLPPASLTWSCGVSTAGQSR